VALDMHIWHQSKVSGHSITTEPGTLFAANGVQFVRQRLRMPINQVPFLSNQRL